LNHSHAALDAYIESLPEPQQKTAKAGLESWLSYLDEHGIAIEEALSYQRQWQGVLISQGASMHRVGEYSRFIKPFHQWLEKRSNSNLTLKPSAVQSPDQAPPNGLLEIAANVARLLVTVAAHENRLKALEEMVLDAAD